MQTAERSVGEQRAVRAIAPVYAGRCSVLTAALQYVFQTVVLGAEGDLATARALEKLAAEEFKALETLGSLLGRMGVNPLFTACPPYPVSYHSAAFVDYAKSRPLMLEADLKLERAVAVSCAGMIPSLAGSAAETAKDLRDAARRHIKLLRELQTEPQNRGMGSENLG